MLKFLTPIFCVLFYAVKSQPIITSSYNPVVGDTFELYIADTTNIAAGAGGANRIWSFNLPIADTASAVVAFMHPSATPYGNSFPNANLAITMGSGAYSYLSVGADSVLACGMQSSTGSATYSDPAIEKKYILQYLESFTDSFVIIQTDAQLNFEATGSRTVTYDGYGSLAINGNTFNNVVRLRKVDRQTTTVGGGAISTLSESYEWIDEGTSHTLLRIENLEFDNGDDKGNMQSISVTSYALD